MWSSDPGLVRTSTTQCWQRTVEVQAQITFRTNVQFSSGARPHSSHTALPFFRAHLSAPLPWYVAEPFIRSDRARGELFLRNDLFAWCAILRDVRPHVGSFLRKDHSSSRAVQGDGICSIELARPADRPCWVEFATRRPTLWLSWGVRPTA